MQPLPFQSAHVIITNLPLPLSQTKPRRVPRGFPQGVPPFAWGLPLLVVKLQVKLVKMAVTLTLVTDPENKMF